MVVPYDSMHWWNILCNDGICSDHCPSSNFNGAEYFGSGSYIHSVREGRILFGKIVNLAPGIASAEGHLVHKGYAFA